MSLLKLWAQAREPLQETAAAIGTATSIGGTGWVWFGHATDILQFIVLVISALTGIASLVYYWKRLREKSK